MLRRTVKFKSFPQTKNNHSQTITSSLNNFKVQRPFKQKSETIKILNLTVLRLPKSLPSAEKIRDKKMKKIDNCSSKAISFHSKKINRIRMNHINKGLNYSWISKASFRIRTLMIMRCLNNLQMTTFMFIKRKSW